MNEGVPKLQTNCNRPKSDLPFIGNKNTSTLHQRAFKEGFVRSKDVNNEKEFSLFLEGFKNLTPFVMNVPSCNNYGFFPIQMPYIFSV